MSDLLNQLLNTNSLYEESDFPTDDDEGETLDTAVIDDDEDEDEDGNLDLDESDENSDESDFDAMEEAALETMARAINEMSEDSPLNEQKNIVRLNRQSRLLNMTNRTAIVMSRKSNDTLYKKYAKHNALRLQFRAQIVKKYGSKAASYARKLLSRSVPATK